MRNYGLSPRQGGVQATPTGGQYRAAMAPPASRATAFRSTTEGGQFNRADEKPKDNENPKDEDEDTKPGNKEEKDDREDKDEKESVATSHQSWW